MTGGNRAALNKRGWGAYRMPTQHTDRTDNGETQSNQTQNTTQMAHTPSAEPLVCIPQAKPQKASKSLTERSNGKSTKLHKKIAIAFFL